MMNETGYDENKQANKLIDPLISVIVPGYKVEDYLNRCVESIINQSYHNLEIILVDDGSPDLCGKMCDDFSKKDERVVVVHKENGGLSDARNAGLDIAKGKYVGFIDSDDYIEKDMFEMLYSLIAKYDADISTCGIYDCFADKIVTNTSVDFFEIVDNKGAMYRVLESKYISVHATNKLYKKQLFDKVRYRKGKTTEDGFIIIDLLMNINRMVITNKPKYYYFHREGSITSSKPSERTFDVIEAYDENYEKVKEISNELREVARMRQCWARFITLDKLILGGEKDIRQKEIYSFLKKEKRIILQKKYFTKGRKISYIAMLINKRLYSMIVMAFYSKNRIIN